MSRRGGSSARWRMRQEKDPYVGQAAREGWRARAVFKLEEIQKREKLLRCGATCIDLGSSPGSWSQYAASLVGPEGFVIAVDLLPMDAIDGVTFLQGDFTDPALVAVLRDRLEGLPVDLVMSDVAPNISGHRVIDQPRSMALAEAALDFAEQALRPAGSFLVKLFQGSGFAEYVECSRQRFDKVKLIKPKASRAASREIYLLARGLSM
jgi:23S rRNA (uridine2552-2'-O)-methyltransferase